MEFLKQRGEEALEAGRDHSVYLQCLSRLQADPDAAISDAATKAATKLGDILVRIVDKAGTSLVDPFRSYSPRFPGL